MADLAWAAERAAAVGVDILVEPINGRDTPSYCLSRQAETSRCNSVRRPFGVIAEPGLDGWIGCEYVPRAGTSEGLGRLNDCRGGTA
ncbi:hypothetical protein GCM10010251_28070 [Streptomyces aurantiogriseus]|uniref:Xylose isomerase-like TIM barrel domain-containing protein n=1 Tax=Streptomyces aurantiogriseus TaxID=66870 RepID=A0A918C844_9ACTN|nr:hypothetical protein GCM10010251_28070 [Streptomyces aurantiogriseus]